jgi:hypothetical protein
VSGGRTSRAHATIAGGNWLKSPILSNRLEIPRYERAIAMLTPISVIAPRFPTRNPTGIATIAMMRAKGNAGVGGDGGIAGKGIGRIKGYGVRLSGNGIRFVSHGEGAQEQEVVERALVDEVEAGFVTVYESERGGGGERGEGGSDGADGVGLALGVGGVFEQAGFDGPSAAHAPVRGNHFLDHAEFHAIGGLEAVEVLGQQIFEGCAGFLIQDDAAGEQAVADGVLGRAMLPLRRGRTLRAGSVGARSQNASE